MTELASPALVANPTTGNITSFLVEHALRTPDRILASRPLRGQWQDVTAQELLTEVDELAAGLIAAGLAPGDRIALFSSTRYEWTLADLAIWSIGAVSVPVYETSSAEQLKWILRDSGAVAAIVESDDHVALMAEVQPDTPQLHQMWQIAAHGLRDLVRAGADTPPELVQQRRAAAQPSDLATIIYTSGTTGRPKGCELTHLNFMALATNTVAKLDVILAAPGAATLLFLPLSHIFARFVQVLALCAGVRLGHSCDLKNLVTDLGEFQPTFLLAVPRVFEKIYNSAETKAHAAGRARLFAAAAEVAVAWSQAQDCPNEPLSLSQLALRGQHAIFDRLVYQRIRAALGGQLGYAVSGGAPLGERLGHFFRGAGIVVLEGYGLTETTAPSTVTLPQDTRIGTVGGPLPGVSIRIGADHEVWIKGPHVMRGYWRNPQATKDAFVDGWFRTGDLGMFDDGVLRITGRKKELLVTSGGKNVAPAALEDRLRAHPLISQCMVVGDQRPYVAALITLDDELLPLWLANRRRPPLNAQEATTDSAVQAEIQRAISEVNRAVSKAESIRQFRVLDRDFTEASGHLTPSLKLKRAAVLADFAREVDDLYQRAPR